MERAKRYITLIAVAAMTLSILAGCSDKVDTKPEVLNSSGNTALQTSKEPTNISMMIFAEPVFKPENNKVVAEVEKKANVKLTFIIPPKENYAEKRNMALASGDIADVVMFESASDSLLLSGIKQEKFLDVKKYVNNAPNLMKYVNELAYQTALTEDGKMVGIPRNTIIRGDGFMIRQDWMEKLKLKEPTTMDEFYEVMKSFAKNDPDGNGKDDTYALSQNAGTRMWDGPAYGFIQNFGGGLGWQEDKDGKLCHTNYVGNAMKDALLYGQKLIREKIVDPEYLSNKTADEKWRSGKIGMKPDYAGNIPKERELILKSDPTAKIGYIMPPVGKDGKLVIGYPNMAGTYWYYAINAKTKNPQAVVNYFDWWLSDEGWDIAVNGLEGDHYTKKDGKIEYKPEYFTDYTTWRGNFTTLKRVGTPYGDGLDYFLSPAIPTEDRNIMLKAINKGTDALVRDKGIGHVTPTELEFFMKTDWPKKMGELTSKILYEQASIDEWDKFLKDYKENGWNNVEKEMNDWYQKVIKGK